MRTAVLGRTGIETSVIGLGMEHLEKLPYEEVAATVEAALNGGVRYMDLFMPSANIRDHVGKLIKGRRHRFQIQGHLGACLQADGQYCRSRDPARAERHAEDLLRRLGTDYLDVLVLHFVDESPEWAEAADPGGILEIAQRWKRQGKAGAIGMSSHKVVAAMAAVGSGVVDVLMFPVNPAFDLLPGETQLEALREAAPYSGLKEAGSKPVYSRRGLFLECERSGVAIVAMKPYGGGWVFRPENPSGIVLTPVQCLQYALSQPGVAVVVPGCKTPAEMTAALAWLEATDQEKDYSLILGETGWKLAGTCMYCNHCLPCPAGIDIAATTRLLDAARKEGGQARTEALTQALSAAYDRLPASAGTCVECGECEKRCPFGVEVQSNMKEAAAAFGR
jgi:uncharacterized protein